MPERRFPPARNLALTEVAGQDTHGERAPVVIRRLPPVARFSLRLAPALLGRATSLAGFALDLPINRRRIAGGKRTLRLGPDEWLLCAPETAAAQIARDVEAALGRLHHALVDLSHAHIALSLAGPQAADAINSGCPLDLSPSAFPPGTATRTLLGKAEIILSRAEETAAFELECARSFAAYVREFLSAAAASV
jgi:sarcosine oxidase, subunit gamma